MASELVLVHGACHGSWCWYKVATLLKSAGHSVTAVDLGGAGIHPKQRNQIPTLSDHLEPLMELMAALPPKKKVVLVGHSMGGVAISLAAEKFPKNIAAAVYVTALMPKPGFNIIQLYKQDLTVAMSLIRPFPIYRDEINHKVATLTEENYGSVHRVYIVSKKDMIITEKFQKEMILDYPAHGVKEISGSDHMVMFSKPKELASLLEAIAEEM